MIFNICRESDKNAAIAAIRDMDLSKPKQVEIRNVRKTRTLDQSALYWEWVSILADEFGNDKEEMHNALKIKILGPDLVNISGEIVYVPPKSRDKNTKDFSDYMDKVMAFALEYGIRLPTPEDMKWASYEKD